MIRPELIPTSPGVYIYKDTRGNIIYIGKAKNLRNRVKSYFSKSLKSSRIELMIKNIADIETITVDNEVEALLLENKLIKKYQPKYNVMAKDAKTFAYIKITDEKYPRIISTRIVTKKGTYFGPYTDGRLRNQLIKLVVNIFKISVCKPSKRPCLNYHIGLCLGTCVEQISPEEYMTYVDKAISFLKGDYRSIIKQLKNEMKDASKLKKYEKALEIRNQIESIELLKEKQKVDLIKSYDQNVIALKKSEEKAKIILFKINKGVMSGKKEYSFDYEPEILLNFVKMYYSQNSIPKEILLSENIWENDHDKEILEKYLERLRGGSVKLVKPEKGEKKRLIELALKNIGTTDKSLSKIQDLLNLPTLPRVIECFDVSNLGSTDVVAGMVQWIDGRPNKSGYRKFEIRTVEGQNDFASMREAVHRRYFRLLKEKKPMPDLIILDGGLGQLGAGLAALRELGLKIPIVSLAKKEEEIYTPNRKEPYKLDKESEVMLLIRSIRDSVHRFAIGYNRQKRKIK